MRKRLLDEFMATIYNKVDDSTADMIKKNLMLCMDKYEISERETAIVPIEYVPEAVKIYLVTQKLEGLADSTLEHYALRLKNFFQEMRMPIDKISCNDIKIYLYKLQDSTGISNRTLNSIRIVLCTFFKWAYNEKYIPEDPCASIKKIKYEIKDRGFLSDIELESLRDACETLRDKAIIELLYSSGCRVSELTHLKKSDIDMANKTITVLGKGNKYRKCYLNAKAICALNKYFDSRTDNSEYVIAKDRKPFNGLTRSMVQKRIKYLGECAGITWQISPHIMRHTTATHGLRNGMSIDQVQQMLGHKSISTTLLYSKTSSNDVQHAHARCII